MLNLYTKIHKAQRAWFARLLIELGAAPEVPNDRTRAALADVRALIAHLHEHAIHEDRFIDPLLDEADALLAGRLRAQHVALEPELAAADQRAAELDVAGTYRAVAMLASQYFPHLDAEETEAMPLLSRTFDDAMLYDRVLRPFVASVQRDEMIADLRLQLIAVSPRESAELLGAVLAR